MKLGRIIAICFLILGTCLSVSAQHLKSFTSEDDGMILFAHASEGKIQLRWLPNNFFAWKKGVKNGYNIYRTTFGGDNERVKLNSTPIKPISMELWKAMADTSETVKQAFAPVMIDSLDGNPHSIQESAELAQRQKFMFGLSLLAANNSVRVAELSGLYFVDKTVKPGQRYIYKIEVDGLTDKEMQPTIAVISCCEKVALPKTAWGKSKFDEESVDLTWYAPDFNPRYAFFDVYRSTKSGGKYEKVNNIPVMPMALKGEKNKLSVHYTDSIPQTGVTYYYKVKGTTMFGESGPMSESTSGTCLRKLRHNPVVTYAKPTNDGHYVELGWKVDAEDINYIKSALVWRANSLDSAYKLYSPKPIPAKERKFTDTKPEASNYYVVMLLGVNGDSVYAMPYFYQAIDSIPPAAPTGLKATVDTSNVVHLSWAKNKEKDFEGYRVFKRVVKSGELIRLTPGSIRDTVFNDTISKANSYGKFYYYVAAIDHRFNTSDLSTALEVKIPFKHPPTAPLIIDFLSKPEGILIGWASSPSAAVVREVLVRKSQTEHEWKVIQVFTPDSLKLTHTYIDSTVKPGVSYIYSMQAIRENGMRSPYAKQVVVAHIDQKIRGDIKNLQLLVSREQRQIKVTWEYKPTGVARFEIYKGKDGKDVLLYTSVVEGLTEYYDKELKPGHKYTYKIRAVHFDGASSTLSQPVTIKY